MKIYQSKARKDYPSENIFKGDIYFFCEPKRRRTGVRRIRSTDRKVIEQWIDQYRKGFRGLQAVNVEDYNERLSSAETSEQVEELINDIESFLEEKRESLENLPEQFQESHMLNDHIEELEELLEQASNLDFSDNEGLMYYND